MKPARLAKLPARRLWAAWLAVLLALFAALAPAVSHAVALSRGGDHAGFEICTSAGAQWLAAPDSGDSSSGQESTPTIDHCPFCLLQADRVAPPPSPVAYLFLVIGGQQEAPVWQAFFYATYFALAPPPRGPPALS